MDDARLRELLRPYVGDEMPDSIVLGKIDAYLDLIVRWNGKTNLTAVREPEAILQRQIGESLFAAQFVPDAGSLMDFGSGAGLPGIPIALVRAGLKVTLVEAQGKKVSFLREAARTLGLQVSVWGNRAEALPAGEVFDYVTMRAVDDSERMLPVALGRISAGGSLLRYLGENTPVEISGWAVSKQVPVPNSKGLLQLLARE